MFSLSKQKKIKIVLALFLLSSLILQSLTVIFINIPLITVVFVFVLFYLIRLNCIDISRKGFYIYSTMLFFSLLTLLTAHDKSSLLSLFYMILLYPMFMLRLNYRLDLSRIFQCFMIVVAFIVVFQYYSQRLGIEMFYMGSFVPDWFHLLGYNYLYEYPYNSGFYKPNGFFFLEPSFVSQFLALSIVIELYTKKRILNVLILLLAVLYTYSGTGIIILISLGGVLLIKQPFKLIIIIVTIAVLILFLEPEFLLSRAGELSSENSSGFIRFVAPALNTYELLQNSSNLELLLGHGPGFVDRFMVSGYLANYTFSFKSIVEYGLIFSLLIHAYIIYFLIYYIDFELRLPLFVFIFVVSGAMLQPLVLIFVWLSQFFILSSKRNIIL